MQWQSEGYILNVRKHGESAAIADILTPDKGRYAGLVHGGAGRRMRPILQPGNKVRVTWKARLADQLGTFSLEPLQARAAQLMEERLSLTGLSALCAMCCVALPERDERKDVYDAFEVVINNLDDPAIWPVLYVKWEAGLLAALGYGLDLSSCAASGRNDNLTHLSPRSGRAVSASEAQPYLDKLFVLPPFMMGQSHVGIDDVENGLKITGHFIESRVLWPVNRTLPEARSRMIEQLQAMSV